METEEKIKETPIREIESPVCPKAPKKIPRRLEFSPKSIKSLEERLVEASKLKSPSKN